MDVVDDRGDGRVMIYIRKLVLKRAEEAIDCVKAECL
jgi:hypothetical protein